MVSLRRSLRALLFVHDLVTKVSFWLGSAALFSIVAIFAYEVVMRYFFVAPTRWASDFVSFLLLASVFLVVPHVTRSEGNVSVSILLEMLGSASKASEFLRRFGFAVGAGVCIWAGFIFLTETQRLFDSGTATLTTVPVPKWTLFSLITLGTFNAGLHFLRLSLRNLGRIRHEVVE